MVVPLAVPAAPRSVAQLTCVTPRLSDAVPETVTDADVVEYGYAGLKDLSRLMKFDACATVKALGGSGGDG